MDLQTERLQLIQQYANWAQEFRQSVVFKTVPQPENIGLLTAKYNDLKKLEAPLQNVKTKIASVLQIRDTELTRETNPSKFELFQEDLQRFKNELLSEFNLIKNFNLGELKTIHEKIDDETEILEYNINLIDEVADDLNTNEEQFVKSFTTTTEEALRKINQMSPYDRVSFEKIFREQEEQFKVLRNDLYNQVLSTKTSLHQQTDQRLTNLTNAQQTYSKIVQLYDSLLSRYQINLEIVNDTLEQLSDSIQINAKQHGIEERSRESKLITINDQPVVRIFLITPPPRFNLKQTYRKLQQDVAAQYHIFKWPAIQNVTQSACFGSTINNAQKASFHYFSPFNPDVRGVILVHSVGSGKTITLRLIASIWARDGYDMVFATPNTTALKIGFKNVATKEQGDFNVQQFTKGRSLEQAVIEQLLFDISSKGDIASISMSSFPGFENSSHSMNEDGIALNDEEEQKMNAPKSKRAIPKPKLVTSPKSKIVTSPKPKKVMFNTSSSDKVDFAIVKEILSSVTELAQTNNRTMGKRVLQLFQQGTYSSQTANADTLQNNLEAYLFGVLSDMGIRQYQNFAQAISYEQLTNLAKDVTVQRGTDFLMKRYPEYRKKDLLYKVFIGIDEAHNVVSRNTNATDKESIDFLQLRDMIWKSYRLRQKDSNYESVVVCPVTAEPIVKHPLDLINLLTLTHIPDESLGFNNYGSISTIEERTQTEQRFIREQFDAVSNKYIHEDKIRALISGHLSYLNLSGARELFAQPVIYNPDGTLNTNPQTNPVQYIPVNLSLIQMSLVAKCFEKNPQILTNIPESTGKIIQMKTKGELEYNSDTKELKLKKLTKGLPAGGSSSLDNKKRAAKMVSECVINNVTFPWLTKSTNKKWDWKSNNDFKNMNMEETKEFIKSGELMRYSPLLMKMLQVVRSTINKAQVKLTDYYDQLNIMEDQGKQQPRNRNEDFKNYKFSMFVDSKNNAQSTEIIAKLLEAQGFNRLNEGKTFYPERGQLYKNFIVLDSKTKSEGDTELLKYFNDVKNKDGRNCLFVVMGAQYKEGVSLQEVGTTIILGMISNDKDFKQAVARSVRSCSRRHSPFFPFHGQTIEIIVLSPSFNANEQDPFYPVQLIEMLQTDKAIVEMAKNELERLMRDTAYDKYLFETINNTSERIDSIAKMYKER